MYSRSASLFATSSLVIQSPFHGTTVLQSSIVQAPVRPRLTDAQKVQLAECFELMDQDGSGAIDKDELGAAFKLLGEWGRVRFPVIGQWMRHHQHCPGTEPACTASTGPPSLTGRYLSLTHPHTTDNWS